LTRFISQDSVGDTAIQVVSAAQSTVDITGAWITGSALRLLLQSVRPKLETRQVALRIVCRLHALSDLEITDLAAIKEFEEFGAQVRFSRRLHAKLVLVDGKQGLVSSSNLTSTAGYITHAARADWTNYEAGVQLEPQDADLVADAVALFERIWADSTAIDGRSVVEDGAMLPVIQGPDEAPCEGYCMT